MNVAKKLLGAFIVGGCFGVIGQIVMVFVGGIMGSGSNMIVPLTLAIMGIIGVVLFAFGIYQKLLDIGGFGAIMPFCGLAAAVAGEICGIRGSGASLGKAVVGGLKPFVILIVIVTILSALIGTGATLIA